MPRCVIILTLTGLLGACSEGEKEGFFSSLGARSDTPVEFGVIPHRPLELPEDLAALPEPRPGVRNRTDLTPIEDARTALGGNPTGSGSIQSDAAILAATGANRAQSSIRLTLAREDAQYRDQNHGKLLERVFNNSSEVSTYNAMILDAELEARRLRALGLRTPEFPPPGE